MQDLTPYLRRWPMPAAVVVDVNWVNGLAAIRSLGRAGVPCSRSTTARARSGFRSRFASRSCAPIRAWTRRVSSRFLVELAGRLDRPAPIFPTHDEQLNAIARNALRAGRRLPVPVSVLGRARADPVEAVPARARGGCGRAGSPYRASGLGGGGARRGARSRVPGAREAVRPDGVQAAVPPPGVPLLRRRRARAARTPIPSRSRRWCRS